MRILAENSILLSFLVFFFIQSKDAYPVTACISCLCLWFLKTKDRSWLIVLGLLAGMMIPAPSVKAQDCRHEGTVIDSRETYAIIANGNERILLYTDAMPVLDSRIRFDGRPQNLKSSSGFYRFDFQKYCRLRRIRFCMRAESITTVRKTRSGRGLLQEKIEQIPSRQRRSSIRKILYGDNTDLDLKSCLRDTGISAAGVLHLLDFQLKWIAEERTRKRLNFIIALAAACFWRFPLLLSFRLCGMILNRLSLHRSARLGIRLLMIQILYPWAVSNAGFLIAACFLLCRCFSPEPKKDALISGMMLQSCLFNAFNPLQILGFRVLLPMLGILRITGLLSVWLPAIPVEQILGSADQALSLLNRAGMPGSILGFGLPFFLAMAWALFRWNPRHGRYGTILLLLLFQGFGWFHPLAEITFLNVGQGDSILIRAPLNQENILIDTGRPEQWKTLSSLLKAKGIRSIETLIATHPDSDHCGSLEQAAQFYQPRRVWKIHHPPAGKRIVLYDLNSIQNENENQSSIVDVFQLNRMRVLCMGDADQETEEQIIRSYPHLNCNILKLSHHGSKTGSSGRFLDAARPQLAVISCGDYSLYHHPSEETLQRLLKRHIPYFSTHEDGDISIFCLPGWNLLLTSTGKIAIIKA